MCCLLPGLHGAVARSLLLSNDLTAEDLSAMHRPSYRRHVSSLSFLCLSLSFCLCLRSHNYLRRSCANYCQWKIDVIWALRQASVKVRIHFKLKYTLWLYSWLHNQLYKWLLKKFWIFIQSNMPHRLLSTRLLSVMQWRHERRVRTAQALLGWAHLQAHPTGCTTCCM